MNVRGVAGLTALFFLFFSTMSFAQISITDAWARATFPMANSGAVYLTLSNKSNSELVLESVATEASIARAAQIHTTLMSEGMMKMREMKKGLVIPAQGSVVLEPGAAHIMLVGLKVGLTEGQTVPLYLQFSNGQSSSVNVPVKPAEDRDMPAHHHH